MLRIFIVGQCVALRIFTRSSADADKPARRDVIHESATDDNNRKSRQYSQLLVSYYERTVSF